MVLRFYFCLNGKQQQQVSVFLGGVESGDPELVFVWNKFPKRNFDFGLTWAVVSCVISSNVMVLVTLIIVSSVSRYSI